MPHPSSLPAALCPLSAFGVATLAASLVNTVQPRLFNSALARLASPQHNTTPKQPNNQTTKQPTHQPTHQPINQPINQPKPTYTNLHQPTLAFITVHRDRRCGVAEAVSERRPAGVVLARPRHRSDRSDRAGAGWHQRKPHQGAVVAVVGGVVGRVADIHRQGG